jgi:hypothetical protein
MNNYYLHAECKHVDEIDLAAGNRESVVVLELTCEAKESKLWYYIERTPRR